MPTRNRRRKGSRLRVAVLAAILATIAAVSALTSSPP
jgi:hypothetical protein